MRCRLMLVCAIACLVFQSSVFQTGRAAELERELETLRSVGPKGAGHTQAIRAWKEVVQADARALPTVLASMDGAGILASNWIRSAAETIADRQLKAGTALPTDALDAFVRDTSHSPRSRRLAFEILVRVDDAARERIIPGLSQDPSLELRRDAIAMTIDRANKLEQTDKRAASGAYQDAFVNARDVDQIKAIATALAKLNVSVDLPAHFGFIMNWNLIGPFDNKDKRGFDVAYAPENEIKLTAEHMGVEGKVIWKRHTTREDFGVVDLTVALAKHKGAICYAFNEFNSASERDCELRIGCINANKVWLNGKLITTNEVYHAGQDIDQYRGVGRLRKGKNQILVKICQNEQTENWAQKWEFQLRICDELGTAILDTGRTIPKAAVNESVDTGSIAVR